MRLTLADVVSEEEFGLLLRSGSPAALARPVEGAETVEADRPVELSAQGYIVLTTGVRLRGNPELQRKLVIEAEARGVAAVGFGVGLVFRSTPRALLDEARRRDFPVFEVPFEVPFRDIIGYINRSHLSADFYSLKRSVAFQNSLLGALEESRPEEALMARLATVVGGAALLYRPGGGVVAESGGAPVAAIAEEITRRAGPAEAFDVRGWRVFVSPILVEGGLRFWLAMASRTELTIDGITRPLVQVAERLLRLIELARDVGVMEERVRRAELLHELLDPRRAREVSSERLELFGFSAQAPWRVALLGVERDAAPTGPGGRRAPATEEVARLVGNAAAGRGHPHLIGQEGSNVALVLQGDDLPVEAWVKAAVAEGLEVRGAVGRSVSEPEHLAESRGDALLALDFLARMDASAGRVLRFEEFELIDALLCAADPGQLRARADLVLRPLRDHPQLLETLLTYLDADLNVNTAAARLHVHPNSLRYRLTRVEEELGRPVRSLATLVDLYLALRAEARFSDDT
ncbi:MAG: helix-turn-helix domain-containing protein [Actinomycetota bacterium]|nr:helix-turn-helix domain-containing protein [Actinomycetota bacterium]